MSAPKNNQNAMGNRGGGRKSAYQEGKDAAWLKKAWGKNFDVTELRKKIDSGVYSVRDVFLLNALEGESAMLKIMADKMLPNREELKEEEEKVAWQPPVIICSSDAPFTFSK